MFRRPQIFGVHFTAIRLGLLGDIRETASDRRETFPELSLGWQPGKCQGGRDQNHLPDQALAQRASLPGAVWVVAFSHVQPRKEKKNQTWQSLLVGCVQSFHLKGCFTPRVLAEGDVMREEQPREHPGDYSWQRGRWVSLHILHGAGSKVWDRVSSNHSHV